MLSINSHAAQGDEKQINKLSKKILSTSEHQQRKKKVNDEKFNERINKVLNEMTGGATFVN